MKKKHISIVLPFLNEEKNLPLLHSQLLKLMKKLRNYDFQLFFVDDGSIDQSLEKLLNLKKKDKRINIIQLKHNFGSWQAIIAGLEHSKADCVGIISTDLQDSPDIFIKMIKKWEMGNQVVIAVRKERKDNWSVTLFANIFNFLFRLLVLPSYPPGGFDCTLLDQTTIKRICSATRKHVYLPALIIWLGYRPAVVHYVRQKRRFGYSKWSFFKRLKLFITLFVSFSSPVKKFLLLLILLFFSTLFIILFFKNILLFLLIDILIMLGFAAILIMSSRIEVRKKPLYSIKKIY